MLQPWDLLFDALHFAAKANPRRQNGVWPVGAALVPEEVRKCAPRAWPSEAAAILAFAGDETMRLRLPVAASERAVVAVVRDTISEALTHATPNGQPGATVPISTALHENGQLCWGRRSAKHAQITVPICRYGDNCDALCLEHAPGPLPVYLTPAEQDTFDETGTVPEMALFCLLCIRRDAQALYLMHSMAPVNSQAELARPTLVVPPFQNLVDVPGGYKCNVFSVPPVERWGCNIAIVGVSNKLVVTHDAHSNRWHVDQTELMWGGHLNGPAAVHIAANHGRVQQTC